MAGLDEKDCVILDLLQKDCRISLTKIAEKVGLSVDSVKKRVEKMIKQEIFFPKIQLRPRHFGFKNIVNVNIKLRNYTHEDISEFIAYLKEHPNVSEIFSLSGECDFSIVIISKDAEDLGNISEAIRHKFNKMIDRWAESLTTFVYKFENYDMLKLMGYKKNE